MIEVETRAKVEELKCCMGPGSSHWTKSVDLMLAKYIDENVSR